MTKIKQLSEYLKNKPAVVQDQESINPENAPFNVGLVQKQMPSAYSDKIYDWIDDTIQNSGLSIPGDHPEGTKTIGKQIEANLYRTLKDKIEQYLKQLSDDKPQYQVVNEITELVNGWQKSMTDSLNEGFNALLTRGIVAGVVDAGVKPAFKMADKIALEIIRSNTYRIGSRIVLFSQGLVERMQPIISDSYTAEGVFNLEKLTDKILKVVPTERFKIERIVRTESAAISNLGRLWGWKDDPYKYYYEYHWNNAEDERTKPISMLRGDASPYTWDEICFLWANQEQLIGDHWAADQYNQRCSISRGPIDEEFKGNRFIGEEANYRETTPLGFDPNE